MKQRRFESVLLELIHRWYVDLEVMLHKDLRADCILQTWKDPGVHDKYRQDSDNCRPGNTNALHKPLHVTWPTTVAEPSQPWLTNLSAVLPPAQIFAILADMNKQTPTLDTTSYEAWTSSAIAHQQDIFTVHRIGWWWEHWTASIPGMLPVFIPEIKEGHPK